MAGLDENKRYWVKMSLDLYPVTVVRVLLDYIKIFSVHYAVTRHILLVIVR